MGKLVDDIRNQNNHCSWDVRVSECEGAPWGGFWDTGNILDLSTFSL